MIKGKIREKAMSFEDVLYLTDGGRDVLERYYGNKLPKICKSPFRNDNRPSFGFYKHNNTWFFKDLADESSGTFVQFVQKMFNLEFKDAMNKIVWDLNLGGKDIKVERVYEVKEPQPKTYVQISFTPQPFKDRHHRFWNVVSCSEDWCKKYDCYAVKDLWIARRKYPISDTERVFAYLAKDEDKVKIYFPDRSGIMRFRNSASYHYLWNYTNIKDQHHNTLIVQKSMKDLIVTSLIYPSVIATQAEAVKIFNDEVVQNIANISDDVCIFYGSDNDGVKKSTAITNEFGWKYMNTPNILLPDINDAYSYVRKYGIKELEKLIKSKI